MSMTGKISKKKVDNYAWGDKVAFLVNGKWVSALVNKKTPPPPEIAEMLRDLKEGDEVKLEISEAPNKTDPTKPPYLNIVGIERITRVGADLDEPPDTPAAQPTGHKAGETDTKIRSMALAYAKDLDIAYRRETEEYSQSDEMANAAERIKNIAKQFEKFILTGE